MLQNKTSIIFLVVCVVFLVLILNMNGDSNNTEQVQDIPYVMPEVDVDTSVQTQSVPVVQTFRKEHFNQEKSITRKNMEKYQAEHDKNLSNMDANELLPVDQGTGEFEIYDNKQVGAGQDQLFVTDRYVIGTNTVGQSLKNPSYDLRGCPPNPKYVVSPWNNSTYEPDQYNIGIRNPESCTVGDILPGLEA